MPSATRHLIGGSTLPSGPWHTISFFYLFPSLFLPSSLSLSRTQAKLLKHSLCRSKRSYASLQLTFIINLLHPLAGLCPLLPLPSAKRRVVHHHHSIRDQPDQQTFPFIIISSQADHITRSVHLSHRSPQTPCRDRPRTQGRILTQANHNSQHTQHTTHHVSHASPYQTQQAFRHLRTYSCV